MQHLKRLPLLAHQLIPPAFQTRAPTLKMVKIALAGATSGIGLAFRQQLDEHPTHEYITLVRQRNGDDAKAVVVDYTSIEALEETLRTHSIHTVISSLSIADEASGLAQLNLIKSASQAPCVKRFLPSEYGGDYKEEYDSIEAVFFK